MHFHILGIGPIGSLVAFHLRRALPVNHTITLIHRTLRQSQEAAENGGAIAIENNGLTTSVNGFRNEVSELPYTLDSSSGEARNHKIGVSHSVNSGPSGIYESEDSIESLIVTTKAHQTLPAIQRLLPRISRDSTIVILQNGMGIYEKLVAEVFRNAAHRPHFVLASNTHGAFTKRVHHVVHAGVGAIEFGIVPDANGRDYEIGFADSNSPHPHDIIQSHDDPAFPRYRTLRNTVAALLLLKSLNTSWRPMAEIQVTMRRKLVVNSVVNPLTALMGCRNGDIFDTEASIRITRRICQEAHDVFLAHMQAETRDWMDQKSLEGIDRKSLPVGRFPRALTRSSLEAECKHVANVTKGNISSMLSDVRRGRRTEIEFLNGYLVGLGSTYKVEMPANAMLVNLIKMRSSIPIDQMLWQARL